MGAIRAKPLNTPIGIRNRAIIAVGYDTLCRRCELVALRGEDLSELEDGAMSILVRRAKNDPFGDGRLGYLTPKTATLLRKWLEISNIRTRMAIPQNLRSTNWLYLPSSIHDQSNHKGTRASR
jgi:integrase